jgi:hypothetical protein
MPGRGGWRRRWLLLLLAIPFLLAVVLVGFVLYYRPTLEYSYVDPDAILRVRIGLATMIGGALGIAAWLILRRTRR